MLREEFENLTEVYVTPDIYKHIEEEYYKFGGDKTDFCQAYKTNKDGLAQKIQKAAIEGQNESLKKIHEKDLEIFQLKADTERLKKEVEKEEEWRLYVEKDNISQEEYKDLASCSSTAVLSDEEAKDFLHRLYGFDPDSVMIVHNVDVLQINRHGKTRIVGSVPRTPCYSASDWYYIRFDAGNYCWEATGSHGLTPFIQ